MKVALVSLEPWNEVWRRNQHLAASLVRLRLVDELVFVEPLVRRPGAAPIRRPLDGVTVVQPRMPWPRSAGGLRAAGRWLRRTVLQDVDLLWVNDPALGVRCLTPGAPAVYDVTDDWRSAPFPARIRRRIVAAENRLATAATTVVCSQVLQHRWEQRYGVDATVVHNGVDARLWRNALPGPLLGTGPHLGYVGTLHEHRLDVDLVAGLGQAPEVGTLHLIGPNHLPPAVTARLERLPRLRLHGPVPAADVPSWMLAMDLLVSPHRVDAFTLSLDAIKAYEYAAAGRPVVATPTSGFTAGSLTTLAPPHGFVDAVRSACRELGRNRTHDAAPSVQDEVSWERRSQQFWSAARPTSSTTLEETHA